MNTLTFQALSDPHRLQMVELLHHGPLTVGEIAARLDLRQPQASKHLRVLSQAGVIDVQARANRRICQLRPQPFQELDDWLGTFRQLWEQRFDQLEAYLHEIQTALPPSDPATRPAAPHDPGDTP